MLCARCPTCVSKNSSPVCKPYGNKDNLVPVMNIMAELEIPRPSGEK